MKIQYLRWLPACNYGGMALESLRHAIRSHRRTPALALISIVTVALGVGAGTALFSVVKAVLLNPLPYPEPNRLAWLAEVNEHGRNNMQVPLINFQDWQRENHSFAAMAAYGEGPVNAGGGGSVAERTRAAMVTQDFFDVMGVHPAIGRAFDPAEQQLRAAGTAVLGYALWRRAYGGDPQILGKRIKLMGDPFTVIGVMPQGFEYPAGAEVWIAAGAFFPANSRTSHSFRVVGRLRPDATIERARSEISAISRRLKQEYPSPFMAKDANVVSLESHIVGEVRPALLMLFGAVGFLLLIVCVNAANLLMVRVTTRAREISIRTALGAAKRHVFRQLLTESLTLAAAGGALGFLVAFWSMDLLRVLLPGDLPRVGDIRIDSGVIAFALAITAFTGILFGVLPALRAARLNVNESLKAGSRSHTPGRQARRTQGALVVSEVCLSLVLVAGAALLLNSFWKLRSVNPGFDAERVMVANISFEVPTNGGFLRLAPEFREAVDSLRAIPGVQAAALVREIPMGTEQPDGHFFIRDRMEESRSANAGYRVVSSGYLNTMRIPVLRGRDLADSDTMQTAPVAVISAEMARAYFPGQDPIGRQVWFDSFTKGFTMNPPKEQWLTIVGVAGDVRQEGLTRPVEALAYVSYAQAPVPQRLLDENFVLRTAQDPQGIVTAVRDRLLSVDRGAAIKFETMTSILAGSIARQRFQMQVLGGFAALALVLAAIGLYGVLSYMVTSNRAEIGIRMALGAQPRSVFQMVTGRALRLAAIGTLLGLIGCIALRTVLAKVLFGIGPSDPATLAAASAVLLAVAFGASWFPARRAMRVDPVSVLREE